MGPLSSLTGSLRVRVEGEISAQGVPGHEMENNRLCPRGHCQNVRIFAPATDTKACDLMESWRKTSWFLGLIVTHFFLRNP